MSTSPMPPFRGLWWGPHLEKPAPELHLQSSLEQEEARTMPGRAVRALGSHSRLLSRGGAPTTRGWKVGQPRGEEGTWVSGTSSPQPHPMVSTGPRGQMASPRPGPWLSLIQMSYERVEWAAASGVGGGCKNNCRETPGQWEPRAMGATVVCHTMDLQGTAAGPTAATDTGWPSFQIVSRLCFPMRQPIARAAGQSPDASLVG